MDIIGYKNLTVAKGLARLALRQTSSCAPLDSLFSVSPSPSRSPLIDLGREPKKFVLPLLSLYLAFNVFEKGEVIVDRFAALRAVGFVIILGLLGIQCLETKDQSGPTAAPIWMSSVGQLGSMFSSINLVPLGTYRV